MTMRRDILWAWPLLALLLASPALAGPIFGTLHPNGNVNMRVGDTLTFTCSVPHERNSSRNLEFTKAGVRVDERLIARINDTSIGYTIRDMPQMDGIIVTCKYNGKGVNYAELFVGSEPKPVTDFKCISNNWETMNCTFNFEANPIQPTYRIMYGRAQDSYMYELGLNTIKNDTHLVYWFKLPDYSNVVDNYTFQLSARNMYGENHQNFTVNNLGSIRPNKPFNLTVTHGPGKSVQLKWSTSYVLRTYWRGNIITELNYTSRFNNNKWHTVIKSIAPQSTDTQETFTNLTAHTWYDVRIRIKMEGALRDELWSDYETYVFVTESRIPDRPPETDTGAFWVSDLNDVVIYWRQLKPYEENAANATYAITRSLVRGEPRHLSALMTKTMAKLQNMPDETLEFDVRSANALGKSRQASYIKVPRRSMRNAYPTELKKNRNGTIYTVSWQPPRRHPELIESYTVFWCKSKTDLPNQCEESIDFKRLGAEIREFTVNTTDGINFAVSANTHNSSSGMVWALCTASESDDIGKLKTIWTPKITATSMDIQWSLECVDRPIVRSYILTYCLITSPKNVTCKEGTEKNKTLPADTTQYTITGLKPYTTYSTFIRMVSSTRVGPPSQERVNTTYEATPSKPLNLMVYEVKNTSVLLRWNAPEHLNGVLNNYEIWYNEHRKEVYDDFLGKTNFTYRLENLTSFTSYEIVVRACSNCCNCSESSNSVRVTTDIGTPGVPDTQMVNDGPRNRILLKWSEPLYRAGNLDYYEVSIEGYTNLIIRTRSRRCYVNVDPPLDPLPHSEPTWTVQIRAVNVIWSAHAKFPDEQQPQLPHQNRYIDVDEETSEEESTTIRQSNVLKRHSSGASSDVQALALPERAAKVGPEVKHYVPQSKSIAVRGAIDEYKVCREDPEVRDRLSMDKYRQELPGPWSHQYIHVSAAHDTPWRPYVMTAMGITIMAVVAMAVYFYKQCYRLKKSPLVLPPGLADIVEKPNQQGNKNGASGMGGGGGGGGAQTGGLIVTPDSISSNLQAHLKGLQGEEEAYDGTSSSLSGKETFDPRAVPAGCVDNNMAGSETSSLHEQEQSLLEDRMDAQSASSSEQHEEESVGEEEEDEQRHQRRGMPIFNPHLQQDVMLAATGSPINKAIQQPVAMQQTVIKPGTNGYVTIAQRSDGYTKLGDLMGYVTHKQLADFGQRMQ